MFAYSVESHCHVLLMSTTMFLWKIKKIFELILLLSRAMAYSYLFNVSLFVHDKQENLLNRYVAKAGVFKKLSHRLNIVKPRGKSRSKVSNG